MKLFGCNRVDSIGNDKINLQFYFEIPWFREKTKDEKEKDRQAFMHRLSVMFALFFLFLVSVASLWIPRFHQLKPLPLGATIVHRLRAEFDFDVRDDQKIERDRESFFAEYPIVLVKSTEKKTQLENMYLLFLKELNHRFEREKKGEIYNIPEDDPNAPLMMKVRSLPKELCHYFSYAGDVESNPDSFKIRDFKVKLNHYFVVAQRTELLEEYKLARKFLPIDDDGAMFEVRDLSELLTPQEAAERMLDVLDSDIGLTNENRNVAMELFTVFFASGNLETLESKRIELASDAWSEKIEKEQFDYIRHYQNGEVIFDAGDILQKDADVHVYNTYRKLLDIKNNPWYAWWKKLQTGKDLSADEMAMVSPSESAKDRDVSSSGSGSENALDINVPKLPPQTFFAALKELLNELYPKIFQVLVILIFCCTYLKSVHSELSKNLKSIWMTCFIVCVTLIIISLSVKLWYAIPYQYAVQIDDYLLLPLALPALILTAIYGGRVALFSGLYVTAISAVAINQSQFETILLGLLVSGVAALAVRNIADGGNFIVHGFMAGFLPSLFALFFFNDAAVLKGIMKYIVTNGAVEQDVLQASDFLTVIAVSLITPVIAFVILTFLDKCSVHIATNLTYLSLIDPGNKLLTQLRLKAPGTYYHSLGVASLGAAAANKIGAKSLKVQTYAMYHDIGKLDEPVMFTENDPAHEAHEHLTPTESARIIRRHVENGVRLGKAEHLKTHVLRAITQHHGDDCISYFYRKEKEATGKEPPHDVFFYAGPKPSEIETTILMLADCCEAASHSLKNPTEEDIRKCITAIFMEKYKQNQLDDSKLTLRELASIRESFITELMAMGHTRVSYTEMKEAPRTATNVK